MACVISRSVVVVVVVVCIVIRDRGQVVLIRVDSGISDDGDVVRMTAMDSVVGDVVVDVPR
jgi:hypothetical protein